MKYVGHSLTLNTIYIQGIQFSYIALPSMDILNDTNLSLVERGSASSQ